MVRAVTFVQVADWLNFYVVKKHPDKEFQRQSWMADDDPWAARAGWSLTSERITRNPDGLDVPAPLGRIECPMEMRLIMPPKATAKIFPHLWYATEAEEAARFYASISRIPESTPSQR